MSIPGLGKFELHINIQDYIVRVSHISYLTFHWFGFITRYACLVAEPSRDSSGSNMDDLVGVVDVTVSRDDEVLQYISGADEYLYVSGIAVLNNFRLITAEHLDIQSNNHLIF